MQICASGVKKLCFYFKFSLGVGSVYQLLFSHEDKISLCSNNEDILAHCKQIFVCHANIVHFVNSLDVVLYLNI